MLNTSKKIKEFAGSSINKIWIFIYYNQQIFKEILLCAKILSLYACLCVCASLGVYVEVSTSFVSDRLSH